MRFYFIFLVWMLEAGRNVGPCMSGIQSEGPLGFNYTEFYFVSSVSLQYQHTFPAHSSPLFLCNTGELLTGPDYSHYSLQEFCH